MYFPSRNRLQQCNWDVRADVRFLYCRHAGCRKLATIPLVLVPARQYTILELQTWRTGNSYHGRDGVADWCCVPHSMFGTASNCANIMNCHSGEVDREIRRLDFQSLDSRRRQFHVEIFFTVHMVIVNDQQKEIPMSCLFQHIATVLGVIDEHAVRFAGIRVVFGIVGPRSYFCCLCGRIFFREGWVCKFIFVFNVF